MNAGHKIICDQFKTGKYAHKENGIIQYCDGAYCNWEYWINEEGITFRLYTEQKPMQAEIDAAKESLVEAIDSDLHVIEARLKVYRELKERVKA